MGLFNKQKPSATFKDIEMMEACGDIYGLVQLLSADSPGVVRKAMDALRKVGPPAVDALIKVLDSGSPGQQYKAALVLGDIGDRRALPSVARLAYSRDSGVRACACLSLGSLKGGLAINPLVSHLADGDEDVRDAAAFSLSALGPEACPHVVAAFARAYQKLLAARACQERASSKGLFDPGTVERSVAAAAEFDLLQDGVARMIAHMGRPEAGTFIGCLFSDRRVVGADVPVVARCGPAAVGPLLDLLGCPDDHVRLRAVLSLGAIKDRKAKKPLEGLLDDDRREIRDAAASALRGITTTIPLVVPQEHDEAMAVMESCEHCGASIDYGSKYCRYCGALLFDTGSLLS